MERYREPLVAYCRRLLGPDEAEDAFQQTLVNALGGLRRDDRDIDLRPWLYRIAHNVAINLLTRSGRHYEELDNQYDGVPQPPDILDRKIRIERLVKEIGDLPERQRAAIVAHELEGRSYEEIARGMDATAPVVRQLIYRARTRLRDACGVLVPAWALRWLVFADLRMAGSERAGDAVAGGAAGASLLKAGTALLATGVIATGAGGLVTGRDHRPSRVQQASAGAEQVAPAPSGDAGTGTRHLRQDAAHPKWRHTTRHGGDESSGSHVQHRRGVAPNGGDGDDSGPEHHSGHRDQGGHDGEGDGNQSEPDDTHESSYEESDDKPTEGDSHGDEPSDSNSGSDESGSSEDSGSPDPSPEEPSEP
jgi:RNA polymerase sigma factor (sigma-70 family)